MDQFAAMEDEDTTPVVIDCGSRELKAGFAGDDAPRVVFPSMIGKVRRPNVMVGMLCKNTYVGDEAQSKRGILRISYPIECGIVNNWDNMEEIWHHTFYNELRLAPEECPVLLTDTVLNPREHRERMAQIMFETFNTPAMYISNKQALSLYSSGNTTGSVVDSGLNSTLTVAIHKGHVLNSSVSRLDIGGSDLTHYLIKLLSESGYSLCCGSDTEIFNDMKEKLGYVCRVPEKENRHHVIKKTYVLPDNSKMILTNEISRCVEPIFQPSLIGSEEKSVHELINNSISKTDPEIHKHLYSNIVLTGGSTMFPGIAERLHAELSHLAPNITNTKIVAAPERKHSTWIGGSMLASMNWFEKLMIPKMEYDEYGPQIVLRKCI